MDNQVLHSYLEKFKSPSGLAWLAPWQAKKRALFKQLGIPTPKSEQYRHTPLQQFMKKVALSTLDSPNGDRATPKTPDFFPELKRRHHVIHDTYQLAYASPEKINIKLFTHLEEEEKKRLKRCVAYENGRTKDPFLALNGGLMQEGIWIDIPADTLLRSPIYLHHILGEAPFGLVNLYLLITVGRGAKATLLEIASEEEVGKLWMNQVKKIFLEEEASLEHYELQTEEASIDHSMTHVEVFQRKKSNYTHYIIADEGKVARHRITTFLEEPKSQSALYGLYRGKGKQHLEHHAEVIHQAPDAVSNTFYRGTANDQATGIFYGNLSVVPQAQHTDAEQLHNGWILSPKARIYAHPCLAIEADEVRCTHGATLQKSDQEALNYLQMRGIPSQKAHEMLLHAFLAGIIDHVDHEPIRQYVLARIGMLS